MKTVTFTDEQMAVLKQTVSNNLDMENDMVTDELFYRPADIRKLASKSDEEIKAELMRRNKLTDKAIDRLIVLYELVNKLKD